MTKPPLNERVVLLLCVFFLLVSMTGCASSGKDVRKDMAARETKHSEEARSFAESYALDRKEAEKPAASGVPEAPKVSRPVDGAWSSIRRRKIDTSKPLALAELVDVALRNNPSTRQAWYNASVELAKKKQEEAALFPALTVSSGATRERQVATRAVNKINQREYSVNAELTYLLFDFGGRSASIEEMVQTLSAANFQYNQSVQDLVLTVEKGYYDFYSSQSAYDAAQSDVATSKKDFEAARARFEAGVAVKLDVLQAQSDYEDALYSLEVAKGDFKNSRAFLLQSLGLAPDTEFQIALPSKELPKWIMGDDVSLLIEKAVMQRHDLASSRATLLSKKAAVKAANSDLWPTFNLGSTVGRDWYDYRAGNGQRAKDYNYSGFLQMNWNLFDGFYLLNKKREAQAEADVALEELIQSELQASTDVWVKYQNYKAAVSKLEFSKSLFETATASYELAFAGYKAGVGSILDLLQAQNKFSDAVSKLIQSKQDVFVAFAELTHATGALSAARQDGNTGKQDIAAREQ